MHRSRNYSDELHPLFCAPTPKTYKNHSTLKLLGIVILVCLAAHPLLALAQVSVDKTKFSLGETITVSFKGSEYARDWSACTNAARSKTAANPQLPTAPCPLPFYRTAPLDCLPPVSARQETTSCRCFALTPIATSANPKALFWRQAAQQMHLRRHSPFRPATSSRVAILQFAT